MKTVNFFNSCLDTFSLSLQNGMSIKTIGFDSKSLNKQLGMIAFYFQYHLWHYLLQISLGILHLKIYF